MADYSKEEIKRIEQFWQDKWAELGTFTVKEDPSKPKYYVLDMFPYPSGAGLHVGHPLGYIATDIVSRFKRSKGFNVLHPMGFDSFGLPAEQYAIATRQAPAVTTAINIATYKKQLRKIGFCYDWSREVQTSDPSYYKWTQWIFSELFNAWYNRKSDKAENIQTLVAILESDGNGTIEAVCEENTPRITASQWKAFNAADKEHFLQKYRLAYLSEAMVNWCPELGTVLSNDEVKDGVSERGGYPVERIRMLQWSMRITAYAERLLKGLDTIEWPEPVKEMQRNWIGKSKGAEFYFEVADKHARIQVFTTRIDTIFGVTFLVLAPEHELVPELITEDCRATAEAYIIQAKNRSERERMSDVKRVSGAFTGSYAVNPFNNERIPIWVADYVLAGYGTGAVMAVPGHDERDHRFAKHFQLPILQVVEGPAVDDEAFVSWDAKIINSEFMNGMVVEEAIDAGIAKLEAMKIGGGKINYRMRDAIFGRQRYWGEPFPVYYDNGIPKLVPLEELPVTLPPIDEYKPTETGEPPLARAKDWGYTKDGKSYKYELTTMPGWAGSSWYYFRYMDPSNSNAFASREALNYWKSVDLYMGGSEHATGHLLYSRFWCKALKDLGYVTVEEPFQKMINQGHIQGVSKFVYRIVGQNTFVSHGLKDSYETTALNVDVAFVDNEVLDLEKFKNWREEFATATFITEADGKYRCGSEVEKMSKSKYNVINPDEIIERYGADTLRMYEMFLGPLELSKPWNTNGIDGVYKFLRRFWNLFPQDETSLSEEEPTREEYKILHRTIRKVEEDINRFSFNTSVSEFMICCNELSTLKCSKRKILEPLVIVLAPFAPHITEELWHTKLGHSTSVNDAAYPVWQEQYLVESSFEYPVSINGKVRVKLNFELSKTPSELEAAVLQNDQVTKWLEGKTPKKIIIVPGKIVNIVI